MTTARAIVTRAARLTGILSRGFTLDTADASDGLEALNALCTGWYNRGLVLPARTREQLTLSTSTNAYTVGTAGTLVTAVPLAIEGGFLRDSGGIDWPLTQMDEEQYNRVSVKATPSRPRRYYYEPGASLGHLYFDETPDYAYTFEMVSWKTFTTFATLDTDSSLATQWDNCLTFNLAVDWAPENGRDARPTVLVRAAELLSDLETWNAQFRVPETVIDRALHARPAVWNFDAGTY